MSTLQVEVRRGVYHDSVVLMQLQAALAELPGVRRVGALMGTDVNKALLRTQGLLSPAAEDARPDDLLLSVEADDETSAEAALAQIDALLGRRSTVAGQAYRPKSLDAAAGLLPDARWVLVSVPGRYAAGVARDALRLGKHVFLYSDNVTLDDEAALKREAAGRGLLVMGPDCGTAIVNGVGFGFANRVRRGPIGLVGASGTGLQLATARIHRLGGGITHALGTGGRDLSAAVGGITALHGLDLLRRDAGTRAIVLLSKPPDPAVASTLLRAARAAGKPVVVAFLGMAAPPASADSNLHFAASLDEAADLAVRLAASETASPAPETTPAGGYLRGLFSGGTLAYETLLLLRPRLPLIHSNTPLHPDLALENPALSRAHTILDLGDDAFTAGRLHPMLDSTLRLQRLAQEAADPEVGLILLDVVLGDGAHPDPAADLAPAIAAALSKAEAAGRTLEVVTVVLGTDDDPQDLASQRARLEAAGARVEASVTAAAAVVGRRLAPPAPPLPGMPVALAALHDPVRALNVGLETFAESLAAREVDVVHVDWRPPAGGDERLMALLRRMKQ